MTYNTNVTSEQTKHRNTDISSGMTSVITTLVPGIKLTLIYQKSTLYHAARNLIKLNQVLEERGTLVNSFNQIWSVWSTCADLRRVKANAVASLNSAFLFK